MKRETVEKLVHKTSNLLAAIYTYGEPALERGEGTAQALREILAIGDQVEEVLREAKRALREGEEEDPRPREPAS